MSSQRNTGAFIAGGVIGGLVGAAVTLWKTPKSGPEFRSALSSDGSQTTTYSASGPGEPGIQQERRFSNPVLGFVEKATAPIVGVDLGKLARDDPQAATTVPIRTSSADARPPTSPPGASEPNASPPDPAPAPSAAEAPGDQFEEDMDPSEQSTHDDDEGSAAHAATTEELTTPPPEYVEERQRTVGSDTTETPSDFPDLPSEEKR